MTRYHGTFWKMVDPAFLKDFYRRIAFKEGEFSNLGLGTYWIAQRWNYGLGFSGMELHMEYGHLLGIRSITSNEAGGQVGALISCMFKQGLPVAYAYRT